jgi:hypothetical protein
VGLIVRLLTPPNSKGKCCWPVRIAFRRSCCVIRQLCINHGCNTACTPHFPAIGGHEMGPSSFLFAAFVRGNPTASLERKREQPTRTAGNSPRYLARCLHRAPWCCVLRRLSVRTAGSSFCSGARVWRTSSQRPRCLCQTSVDGDATSSLSVFLATMAGETQLQQSACGRDLGGVIEPVWRLACQFLTVNSFLDAGKFERKNWCWN